MKLFYAYSIGKCKNETIFRQNTDHRCNLKTGEGRACLGHHIRVKVHKGQTH